MADFDLVICGGTVFDGTGAAGVTADVGIRDGKVSEVGKLSGNAKQTIDANGAMVTPGFVDIHTHYDGQATWSNRLSPSSHHGVTTVVMGNCGVGFAPCKPEHRELLIQLMEGVEDIPGAALNEGLPWEWETFPQYMDYLGQRQFDMDIGAQLPHAAMRVYVMGLRGANREPANADDIALMQQITAEALRAGALGFTSSRTLNHRSSTGAPTPSLTAETDELLGISAGLRDAQKGVIEMISDFDDLEQEFSTLEKMVTLSGRPMSISLAQGLSPHGYRKILGKLERANETGLVMRGQVAPRPIGILLGYTTTLNPFTTRPGYQEIAHLPLLEKVAALKDPARKARLLAEEPASGFQRLFKMMADGNKLWELADKPDYEPPAEQSLAARAQQNNLTTWSLVYDRLLDKDGQVLMYLPFANYAEGNLDACREMMMHQHTVMGLGDGGAHVGTICDASFTTTLLSHWGKARTRGEQIDLAKLVQFQTADTANAVGLYDRGKLLPGMRADINVIDFQNLRNRAPEIVHDLPMGGARLQQRANGYLATIVRGEVTYRNSEATDALPGRLIR